MALTKDIQLSRITTEVSQYFFHILKTQKRTSRQADVYRELSVGGRQRQEAFRTDLGVAGVNSAVVPDGKSRYRFNECTGRGEGPVN